MIRAGRAWGGRWNDYWFEPEPVIGLALFRICFGALALLYHLPRLPYIPALYTSSGFLWPIQPASWLPIIAPLPLPLAYFLSLLLIIALAAVTLGYRTRSAALIAFCIHTYLALLESFATNSIRRVIAIYLFFLIFSKAGAYFSWEAKRLTGRWAPVLVPRGPATMRRLMVWQLAALYMLNAAMKVTYGFRPWLRGDTIIWALKDITWSQPWASRLAFRAELAMRVMTALGFLGYLTLGPALLWKKTMAFAIVFGLSWHFVTLIMTTISPAWLAWVSIFILVPDPRWWERQWEFFRKRQISRPRLALAAAVVVAFVLGAVMGR